MFWPRNVGSRWNRAAAAAGLAGLVFFLLQCALTALRGRERSLSGLDRLRSSEPGGEHVPTDRLPPMPAIARRSAERGGVCAPWWSARRKLLVSLAQFRDRHAP